MSLGGSFCFDLWFLCLCLLKCAVGFAVEYQWIYLNYTWDSADHYRWAVASGNYIPENNSPVGMAIYKNAMFLSIPRFRRGIPATLTVFDQNRAPKFNPSLTPYPDWKSNDPSSCRNLQSIQSMEVDTRGIMWVIDGVRMNNFTQCPPKLVLLDLNVDGNLIQSFNFPQELCLTQGGFLNDLVVDEHDGGFAYITDNSAIDPGIIVYSRRENRAWKLRDKSMFSEPVAVGFPVSDFYFNRSVTVDGIALSPRNYNNETTLYYTALTSFTLYSVPTTVIRDERSVQDGSWRNSVTQAAKLFCQVDGIIIDSKADMYLTLLPLYGVGKWNINRPSEGVQIIHQDQDNTIWPDGFAFDQRGFLYVISNQIFRYIDSSQRPFVNSDVKFRVLKKFTATNNYLYN